MATLPREYRKQLERAVITARGVAEEGARKAIKALAVHQGKPGPGMTEEQKRLRIRLRAHARQLGDREDAKRDTLTVDHLAAECAYEHWHRMLFARFLAECDLLIEPGTGIAISFAECQELARERKIDWLELASSFAVRMLPQIFRAGDPVLELSLPPETRHELEGLLKTLPDEVFKADDSLGWVYQFWQAERKDAVNKSGVKIGADELPAVTELFTEDYMVLFLLHNTLGVWWTAKRKAQGWDASLPGYEWTYLRLKDDGTPAVGSLDGWPRAAKDIKVLDPSMGSGHFLVFALPILVGFRMEEERLSREQAVEAVLRDNLFGLEIDPRCTQIAAFNLAWTAWRMVGYRQLPSLNLASSGLGINAKEDDWVKLAGKDERARETMRRLYHLFEQAPILGSLIDPKRVGGTLFATEFHRVQPLLERALTAEQQDENARELAVAAHGLVGATRILADEFTLVTTNVPYLGRGKQSDVLKDYCEAHHPAAKADLATCFVERCLTMCTGGGTVALVTTHNWLFLSRYKKLREALLKRTQWSFVTRLGPRAFETISGEVVSVVLVALTRQLPQEDQEFLGLDVTPQKTPDEKAIAARTKDFLLLKQRDQLTNPDYIIQFDVIGSTGRLGRFAFVRGGITSGDSALFRRAFWEVDVNERRWEFEVSTVEDSVPYGGRQFVLLWENGKGTVVSRAGGGGATIAGREAWGRKGIAISYMSELKATLYNGELFENVICVLVPRDISRLPALWAFCSSKDFSNAVRAVNQKLSVDVRYFEKAAFDVAHWQQVATQQFPDSLPDPHSNDPTQWLFNGNPKGSEHPLQVAVCRLLGYHWPRQTGSSFMDCQALGPDGLEPHADHDGIVCLGSLKGEPPAADRLRTLLADAYGSEWSAAKQAELLRQVGFGGQSLEDWLRDGFFEQHCDVFHHNPFIWHIWDGLKNGFHALVNYHKLAAPNGEGRRTLDKLIYTYLGDWIDRQRADQQTGVEGADLRLAAALHLKAELEKIRQGELPYDIFVRWKPLHEQPIDWDPDINDGVRLNIRPFMTARPLNGRGKNTCILRSTPKIKWEKDRGKEPHRPKEGYPWFWKWDQKAQDFSGGKEFDGNRWNDLHYSVRFKLEARERQTAKSKEQHA